LFSLTISAAEFAAERNDHRLIRADLDGDGVIEEFDIAEFAGRDVRVTDYDADGVDDLVAVENGKIVPIDAFGQDKSGFPLPITAPLIFESVWTSMPLYMEDTKYTYALDFTGDGMAELVFADYNGPFGGDVATLRIFQAMGDNEYVEVFTFDGGPRIWMDMTSGDTDGNGKVELIAGKFGGSYLGGEYVAPQLYFFEFNDSGQFENTRIVEIEPMDFGFAHVEEVSVADIDGDSIDEVIVGLRDSEDLFSTSKGTQFAAYKYVSDSDTYVRTLLLHHVDFFEYLTAAGVGDTDADGKVEIIFFERVAVNIMRFEKEPAGWVLKETPTGISAGICTDLKIIDADDDGEDEILGGMQFDGSGRLGIIEHTANDTYQVVHGSEEFLANTVIYVDADMQMSPPMLAGGAHSAEVLAMRYQPSRGEYTTIAHFPVSSTQVHQVRVGHFDGDAHTDLLVTCSNGGTSSGIYTVFEAESEFESGDCDGDNDVDLADFSAFQLCFTGPEPKSPLAPSCFCVDFNADGDVDLADFGQFQTSYTGAG
jgi:hypothetical protein